MISSGFSIPRAGGWQGGWGGDQVAPSAFLSGGFSVLPAGSLAAVAPADACAAAARSHPAPLPELLLSNPPKRGRAQKRA